MFSLRNQLGVIATGVAALLIAAIPVTFTFALGYNTNSNYNANYNSSSNYNAVTYRPTYINSGYQQPQQQYTYWCTGQNGSGYYSSMPCPAYQPPVYQPAQTHQYTQQYTQQYQYSYPQYSYSYPQYYYPMYSAYNYGASNYNYNYNYNGYW